MLGICLPVPALALTGLSIPLPTTVERLAAALVPWAEASSAAGNDALPTGTRGAIVRTKAEAREALAVTVAESNPRPQASPASNDGGAKDGPKDGPRHDGAGGGGSGAGGSGGGSDSGGGSGGGGSSGGGGQPGGGDPGSSDPVQDVVDVVDGTVGGVVDDTTDVVDDTTDTVEDVVDSVEDILGGLGK